MFLRPVTFREGLTIRQMAAIFEEKGFGAAGEGYVRVALCDSEARLAEACARMAKAGLTW